MLRKRKTRGYNESNDQEDDGGRKYNLRDKIRSERFDEYTEYLQDLHGNEVSLKLIQRHGFEKPILVKEPEGLNLKMPDKDFLVRDVRDHVGDERIIDVMDVRTQKNIEMTMKDWCKYYESKRRDKLLNVISLEFSHTELDELVEAPMIVKSLDWVDLVWPKFLKESQTESTNKIDKMKYPKVQKYCLMSVKGSYTDFHIDFGGTSVWYHILRGKKIFWMVPPTELNLQTFEEWTLSGMQQEIFFGDTVEECFRVELIAGNTFFIPSGWIHAVYTLEDSLVFGGNFLHSFGIENQLKVSKVEDATKVPVKFRYPFYTEIQWYVVQHYVHSLTGKDHLHPINKSANTTPEKQTPKQSSSSIKSTSQASDSKSKRNIKKDDDETETESEKDESDTTGSKSKLARKKPAPKAKNNRAKTTKSRVTKIGASKKKTKKRLQSSSDEETERDESETEIDTEIDSDVDLHGENEQPATCRMTKNSLLRLQYEVEDKPKNRQEERPKSNQTKKDNSPKATKISGEQNLSSEKLAQDATQSIKLSSDIDKLMSSHHDAARLNGWSSTLTKNTGNQASWSKSVDSDPKEPKRIHITRYEFNGLKLLIKHLGKLSGAKKNLPTLIRNSRSLLDDCKKMLAEHENDDPELAITGKPITLELLNPDKTDMNHLIEQFFKNPAGATVHDNESTKQFLSAKCQLPSIDSTTLTQQQRNKFIQNSSISKRSDERKSSGSASDSSPSLKEPKIPVSPNKKSSSSATANPPASTAPATLHPFASSATTSSISGPSASNNPRPKSPPTRPLSNNQYKPKGNPNSLVLPGSFADLIAATSTKKKVFDVSVTDVTSTLFRSAKEAPRSPNKSPSSSVPPHKTTNQTNPENKSTTSPFDLLTQSAQNPLDTSHSTSNAVPKPNNNAQKDPQLLTKPNSPEPPKMSPPKRFINPAFKPPNKEKLIFASAPYVSPVSQTTQLRPGSMYPWQSPASHQQPLPNQSHGGTAYPAHNPPSPQKSQAKSSITMQKDHETSKESESGSVQSIDRNKNDAVTSAKDQSANRSSSIIKAEKEENLSVIGKQDKADISQNLDETARSLRIDSSINDSTVETNDTSKVSDDSASLTPSSSANQSQVAQPQCSAQASMQSSQRDDSKAKKPTKPRGPPKKSKEARQVIVSSPPRPIVTTGQRFLITQAPQFPATSLSGQPNRHMLIPGQTFVTLSKAPQAPQPSTSDESDKPKAKRPKKQKEGSKTNDPSSSTPNASTSGQQPVFGLVAPTMGGQVTSMGNAKTAQQYLISRPLMFNTMQGLSPSQLQQIPRAHMPILSATMPPPLSLPNMQQGARIVWATQPRLPMVSTAALPKSTSGNSSTSTSSTITTRAPSNSANKSSKVKSAQSTTATPASKQPDNAALLSLATTALSTAPMPTTPTLSYLSGVRPPTGQAIMVSSATGQPALLAGQPFYNQFIPQLPMMAHYPSVSLNPPPPGMMPPVRHLNPVGGAIRHPSGQLLFAHSTNQRQPRFLITHPYLQPRPPQIPTTVASQPGRTLAFAAFRPPCPDNTTKDGMKAKKVKTR